MRDGDRAKAGPRAALSETGRNDTLKGFQPVIFKINGVTGFGSFKLARKFLSGILKILKEDQNFSLEIFGLKCVSDHSKLIPEKKFRLFFDFGPPKMAPQRQKIDKNTQN